MEPAGGDRVFREVGLAYRLASGHGGVSAATQSKRWFFEVPAARDTEDGWRELLHRLFYDANVRLRRAEPNDGAWLALDTYEVRPVEARKMLDWPGATDAATVEEYLPWHLSNKRVVWEWAACLWVDAEGRYDGLADLDFCELIAYRLLDAGEVDEALVRTFVGRLYPRGGDKVFADRVARQANITRVRPTPPSLFRKSPGQEPWVSGPPNPTHLGL